MAQLKDSVVSGNLRVTDTTLTDTLQVTTIKAPTSSGGTTYGPGTSGQVLKSNGSSVYWTSDSNTDEKVKVTANTTTKGYLIASTTSPNGTAVEGIADTGVYLGTTAGSLYATSFYENGTALSSKYYGSTISRTANTVLAAPDGSDGTASFRKLVAADLPDSYLPTSGGTVSGTLVLSKTQDASGTANNSPALIVGGAATSTHLELDSNEIMAKTNGTSTAALYINNDGGDVYINNNLAARHTATPTSGQVVITDGTSGGIKSSGSTISATPSAVVTTNWNTASERTIVVTKGWMSYWNGAYNGTSSNLAYCNKGAFGTIVTKSTTDYSKVSISRNLTSGTKVGTITIDGTATDLYCQTNTDENVLQSDTSSTSDFRPILLGTTHTTTVADLSATITGQAYVSSNIFVKPNTGIICAEKFSTLSYINGTGTHLEQYGLYLKSYKAAALPAGGDYSYKEYVVRTYDGKSANNGGMLLTMDGGGLTIIGSGSAVALADLISDDQQDSNTSRTRLNIGGTLNTAYHGASEYLILSSNKNIFFLTNCSTIADRKPVVLDIASRFYPGTTNTGSIGISSYQWNTIYGKTIYENGTSLASKYAAIGHTHDYAGSSSAGGPATSVATEVGNTAGARPVFYAYLGDNTRVVYNTNFTYNPSGNVLTATKFVGALDGTANQAIKLRSSAARTDSTVDTADTTPYQKYWVKIASSYTTGDHVDLESLWAVNDVYGNRQGILKVRARVEGTAGTFGTTRTIRWLVADNSIDVNRFAIVCYNNRKPDGTQASGTATVELWWKSTEQYASFSFVLLDETRRTGKQPNDWVLYDTSTYGQAALPTTGNITYSVAATILNSTAQTYNVAKNPSTATTYAISFGGAGETGVGVPTNGTFTTGVKDHYVNDGLGYRTREGVANGTEGLSALVLGNSLALSVAKNKTGYVRQYSTNEYYTDLKPNTLTASRTILLPDASGTIAVFPAARTSGQVVVTDGTAGGIKSSGYTIAKSVPSDALFTDANVTQSKTETTNYRPIVFGATDSTDTSTLAATVTAQTYVSTLLYAQPHDGILYANRMYLKAPGSKGQLNLLTSKYNVMLRNDDSNTYFLVTAQNDPTGTWTSARPLTINNSTGVCNINGTSSSWATARTLTLDGQLTGSVSVKGDANMTLKGYLDRAFIYDDNDVPDGHTWAEYAWHKFAEVTITGIYEDRVITFLVSRTHGSSAEHTGILSAKFRTNRSVSYDSAQLKWLVRNSGLSKDDFVMVYTSTYSTSTKVELWCRLPDQYHGLVFTVLKEHQRHHSTDTSWTLVKTPDGTGGTHGSSSYPTTGITGTIISSDGTITNSTTGTATSANALNLTHDNELNFSKLASTGHVWFGYRWNTQGTETSGGTTITTYKFGNANGAQGLAGLEARTAQFTDSAFGQIHVVRSGSTNAASIKFSNSNGVIGAIGMTGNVDTALIRWNHDTSISYTILDSGNTSFTRTLSSGTKIGTIKINGTSTDLYYDNKVKQSETTTENYRPLVLGAKYSSNVSELSQTVTDQVYTTTKIYAQPFTGTIFASKLVLGAPKTADGAQKGQMKFFSGNASDATGTVTLECVNDAARTGDYTVKLPTWNGAIPVFEKLFDGALSTVSLSYSDIDEYDLFLITVANSNATSEQVTVASLWISNVVGVHDMPLIWGGTPSSSGGACNVTSGWIQLSKNSGTTTFSVAHKSKVAQMTNSGWSISSPTYTLYIRKIFGLKAYKRV